MVGRRSGLVEDFACTLRQEINLGVYRRNGLGEGDLGTSRNVLLCFCFSTKTSSQTTLTHETRINLTFQEKNIR